MGSSAQLEREIANEGKWVFLSPAYSLVIAFILYNTPALYTFSICKKETVSIHLANVKINSYVNMFNMF